MTNITIIGAGISGLCTGYILHQAGLNVQILHDGHTPMDKTSSTPCALLDARPVNDDTPHAIYNKIAFKNAYTFYDSLSVDVWAKRGLIKFPHNQREANRFHKMLYGTKTLGSFDANEIEFIDKKKASELLNINAPSDGLYFKNGGAVYPHKIRDVLKQNLKISHATVLSIKQHNDSYSIKTSTDTIKTDIVILATGHHINNLCPKTMPHTITRGQIAVVDTLQSQPRMPVSMSGYVIPTKDGYVLGATSNRDDLDNTIRQSDFNTIGEKNAPITNTPVLINPIGKVGFRSNPTNRIAWSVNIQKDLYVVGGQGSRGFINAPLCAEIIKSLILKEDLPISSSVLDASLYEHYGI